MPSTSKRAERPAGRQTPRTEGRGGRRARVTRWVLAALRRHWLLGLGVLAIAGIVVAVNPLELARVARRTAPGLVALMLPATLLIYVARAVGWWGTLRGIGVRIPLGYSIGLYFAGQATKFVPGGDLGRVAMFELLDPEDAPDAGALTGTVAYQELSYLLLMGLATIPAAAERPLTGLVIFAVMCVEGTIFVVLAWPRAYEASIELVTKFHPLRRFHEPMTHVRPAFLRLFRWRTALVVWSTNVVAVGLAFLLFELALHAVGANRIGYAQAAFIYALAHVLGALSMLPGGLGIYEGVMTGFIALQGASPSQGAVAALLYRGLNDVLMALIGLGAGALMRRARSRRGGGRRAESAHAATGQAR